MGNKGVTARHAAVVSDFPILARGVVRQLGQQFRVECHTWNEFLESCGPRYGEILVVDATTLGEQVVLELVCATYVPFRLVVASLHTNEVRLYRSDGTELRADGELPSLLSLQ